MPWEKGSRPVINYFLFREVDRWKSHQLTLIEYRVGSENGLLSAEWWVASSGVCVATRAVEVLLGKHTATGTPEGTRFYPPVRKASVGEQPKAGAIRIYESSSKKEIVLFQNKITKRRIWQRVVPWAVWGLVWCESVPRAGRRPWHRGTQGSKWWVSSDLRVVGKCKLRDCVDD